jgi:hypothetical protein
MEGRLEHAAAGKARRHPSASAVPIGPLHGARLRPVTAACVLKSQIEPLVDTCSALLPSLTGISPTARERRYWSFCESSPGVGATRSGA